MKELKKILVTGGSGFIGGTLIRKLLKNTEFQIINVDYINYASDLISLKEFIEKYPSFSHFKIDLSNKDKIFELVENIQPDLIFHLAAESHVDRSIKSPKPFLDSNVIGTFNLLEASRKYWNSIQSYKKDNFRIIHVSTDEVFGSISGNKKFNENSSYDPRSPYSASKAASDHLMRSWHYTYGLPILITNCTNNFGPYQFPEKLIPLSIINALSNNHIQIYGDGENIRDWLFVEDHIEALILVANKGLVGESYCIGGGNERTNLDVVRFICNLLDDLRPMSNSYSNLIKFVKDRPGHDKRYAIDSSKIEKNLGWRPKLDFEDRLKETVLWYLKNQKWSKSLMKNNYEYK